MAYRLYANAVRLISIFVLLFIVPYSSQALTESEHKGLVVSLNETRTIPLGNSVAQIALGIQNDSSNSLVPQPVASGLHLFSKDDVESKASHSSNKPHQCYSCISCKSINSNTPRRICPGSPDSNKNFKCITAHQAYPAVNLSIWYRGCPTERGTCAELKKLAASVPSAMQLLACDECQGDLCNGAMSIKNPTIAVIATVFTALYSFAISKLN